MGALVDLWSQFYATVTSTEVTTASSIFKLAISLILGSCVGLERKRKGQTAGVRTFALISMGATLAMILSIYLPQEYMSLKNGDPGRIAAHVVTGIGFLGAGAIIQMKGSVRGLTTAAGIWMIAAISMCVGAGMYAVSVVATLLILFILILLEQWERRTMAGAETRTIRLKLDGIVEDIDGYRDVLLRHNIHMINVYVEYDYENSVTRLNLVVLVKERTDYLALFAELKLVKETLSISLANQVNL